MTLAIFIHDSIFYPRNDQMWAPGAPDRRTWEPYLTVFDRLTVAGRLRPTSPPAGASRADRPGVNFVALPDLASPARWLTRMPEAARQIDALIAPADLVIARTSVLGNLAAFCALRAQKNLVFEVVGCPLGAYWHHGSIFGKIYAPLAALQTRALAARAPFVHYVTRRYLQGRYPARGQILALSDARIDLPDESVLRERLARIDAGISHPARVGMIAAFDLHYKGLDVLLKAISLLPAHLRPTLHIAGSGEPGPWLARARQMGLDGVLHFEGVLPREEVVDWLDTLDLYVQPSREDALPRSVVEALSRAVPTLGSSAGGLPELLPEDALHTPGDAQKLAGDLRRYLTQPALLKAAATRGVETAGEVADPARAAEHHDFLRQAASLA
ncbi:glycosyltransferase family 4 protein [Lujinxingia vulgaris]|uniref:Glycosyltransferase family 4 protein n=1 Tax=Lujinxingia vulgaris TaxID=2600176 RepID=A0A5C6XHE3_9DELT|nr:glycosyltransferase family 4 protein [Lujinxingia vulgaris]TXD36638.1 glycosyltransferase family 4 protein [Lujinxingia vulgaris]